MTSLHLCGTRSKRPMANRLGNQPYLRHLCYEISKFIEGDTKRLLIDLPPQHLKSFVGTVSLAAYLLGTNPRLRIILVAYNDVFAEALCSRIRDLMISDWYQATFTTRIKDGHSRANDFGTKDGGGVFAASEPVPSRVDRRKS